MENNRIEVNIQANAKINLMLDILGKRENGYHDLFMVMQTVSLYDEVSVCKDKQIKVLCDVSEIPADKSNTAYKAAEGFFEYVAGAIAAISVKVLAFILTFILVAVILKMISIMFGIIEKIPGLSHVNKLVGLRAGFVRSFIIIWLIMIVIAFAGNYQWGQVLLKLVLDNPVAAFFYHHNLLAIAFLSIF